MKVYFSPEERAVVAGMFTLLIQNETDRSRKRDLTRVYNKFRGEAPVTIIKYSDAAKIFTAVGYLLQRDEKKQHKNRPILESIIDKLTPKMVKENLNASA